MKTTLSRLFIGLSAFAFLLVSCTKEENPGGQEGEPTKENTFIAVNEAVKSTLDDNLTPVWVSGDAIGVTTASDANVECPVLSPSEGTFDGSGVTGTAPFYAVYPYNAANTFSGNVLTAVVPQTQTVSAGEFVAPGALVAACKSSNRELAFKNCVALLRIAIPRNDIKSVTVTASGEGEYLAGKFTMDITGTPLAPEIVSGDPSLSASVVLTTASGTDALDPGTYYIAVIPGEISGISLTFQNTSDQTVSISKTVTTTLARSSGANLGTVLTYEISTPAELAQWARESAKFTTWDIVNLNADLDMSSLAAEYVEAVDFKGQFHGNNHTISGLTTPMFSRLVGGCVDNLTLDSTIDYSGNTANMKGNNQAIGLLTHVCALGSNPETKITNVTTRGSLTVTLNAFSKYFSAGGLMGSSNGVSLEGCKNYADITIESITLTGESSQLRVGGLSGQLQTSAMTIKDSENHGDILIKNGCTMEAQCIAGGIAGYVPVDGNNFENCDNEGNITNAAGSAAAFFTAGILGTVGYYHGINYPETGSDKDYVRWSEGTMKNCDNTGAIEDKSKYATAAPHYVGGVLAWTNNSGRTFTNCTNNNTVKLTAASSTTATVGGLIGDLYNISGSNTRLKNCENKTNGAVTINTVVGAGTAQGIYAGGVVGYSHVGPIILLDCINRADLTNNGTSAGATGMRIGGLIGWVAYGGSIGAWDNDTETATNPCYNYGNVSSSSAQYAQQTSIGGLVGQGSSQAFSIYGSHNRGDVSFESTYDGTVTVLYAGGIAGNIGTIPTIKNCTSSCAIIGTSVGTITTKKAGSILGRGQASKSTVTGCRVAGSVFGETIDETHLYIGGTNVTGTVTDNSYLSE